MLISKVIQGRLATAFSAVFLAVQAAPAQDAGVVVSPDNTVLVRTKGKKWEPMAKGAKIPGEAEVLAGGKTSIQALDGDVSLEFRGDLAGINPFPIHESVVQLFPVEGGVDMDLAPRRGRVDLINTKKEGSATVRIRVFGETSTVVMKTPGTRFTLEMFGRWKAGDTFKRNPVAGDGPTINVLVLVINGEILISHKDTTTKMAAPPGPALLQFTNRTTEQVNPDHLDELPPWAVDKLPRDNPQVLARLRSGAKFMNTLMEKGSLESALDEIASSDEPSDRRLAIFAMAATDNLPRVWSTMLATKSAEVMDDAVVALRHWIGREEGQDKKLWEYLVNERKYTENQADQALELLHSFSKEDLLKPELYEQLILLLNAKRDLPRVLAYWHLIRLVPQGEKIGYSPLAKPEERKAAAAKWAELIPRGKVPANIGDDDESSRKPKQK